MIIFLQDILLNDDFKLDWTFRMSFASDIARVSQQNKYTKLYINKHLVIGFHVGITSRLRDTERRSL